MAEADKNLFVEQDVDYTTITVTCPLPGPDDPEDPIVPEGGCLNGGIPIEVSAAIGGDVVCGMCETVMVEHVEPSS